MDPAQEVRHRVHVWMQLFNCGEYLRNQVGATFAILDQLFFCFLGGSKCHHKFTKHSKIKAVPSLV